MAAEQAARAVEARFSSVVEEVERASRPVLKAEFECSARCAANTALSAAQFQECVTRCGAASHTIGHALNHEINLFQDNYVGCLRGCEGQVMAKLPAGATSLPAALEAEVGACATRCANLAMETIPAFLDRMQAVIKTAKQA